MSDGVVHIIDITGLALMHMKGEIERLTAENNELREKQGADRAQEIDDLKFERGQVETRLAASEEENGRLRAEIAREPLSPDDAEFAVAELRDALAAVTDYLRAGTFDEEPGEADVERRALSVLERYSAPSEPDSTA